MADPLIALYRADWTRWSFSAEVVTRQNAPVARMLSDKIAAEFRRSTSGVMAIPARRTDPVGSDSTTSAADEQWSSTRDRILLAPEGRYRYEPSVDVGGLADLEDLAPDERVTLVLSDGESCCVIRSGEGERSQADPALTPIDWIVRPAWLMPYFRLTLTGTTELAGRPMLMVRGTPRPRPNPWDIGVGLLDRIDLLVDAELGVIRRRQAIYQGQPLSVFEMRDFTLAPPSASDPASFRPDDSVDLDDSDPQLASSLWRTVDWDRPGWPAIGHQVVGAGVVLSVAKGVLYLAARGVARPEPPRTTSADDETEPLAPDPAEAAPMATEPISDRTLRLIAQVGMPPLSLSAQVHYWLDAKQALWSRTELGVGLEQRDLTVQANFLGTERGAILQVRHARRIAFLRVAMLDRYRIEFQVDQGSRQPRTVACDGERLRKIYHNRVIASPAHPLPTDFITLTDPAWLLGDWRLTEGGQEIINNRPAIRVQAVPPPHQNRRWRRDPPTPVRIDLLIDAELGIVLRQVSYAGDQPVVRIELRDVTMRPEVDPFEFGSAIAPDLPVISTSGEPVDDLDLPPIAKSLRDLSSGLTSLFRRPR